MKVKLKNSEMIKPAKPTWNTVLSLSELDQTGAITHVPTLYFYKPPQIYLTPKNTIPKILKDSLSEVLVHFYPLAGRLVRLNGERFNLDCNSKGVQFLEAETEEKLDVLGDFSPSPLFLDLTPNMNYFETPIEDFPLVIVQVTKFSCGGVSLCLAISHAAADGKSALHFISEWGNIARGGPLCSAPSFDRVVLRPGEPLKTERVGDHEQFDPLPVLLGQSKHETKNKKEPRTIMIKMSKDQVSCLKNRTNEDIHGRPYTRCEAITGHIWRTACKARGHLYEQKTSLDIAVDARNRIDPPLPEKFFGNGILDVFARGCSGEIVSKPLVFAASKVREAIERVKTDYVHSGIDYLKTQEDLSRFQDIHAMLTNQGPAYGNPNVSVTSWLSLPLYGMNFGWGSEVSMGFGSHLIDGDSLIIPGHDGDGSVVVAICFQAEYMEAFNKLFYEDIV